MPTVGTYDYLVRFSDDGRRTWVYGDQDGYIPGVNSGTNMPGVMTITPIHTHPVGMVMIGCPFTGPVSVREKMIIRKEKMDFER